MINKLWMCLSIINYSLQYFILTLNSCSPIGRGMREKTHSFALKDWGRWAFAPMGMYVVLANGCRQHHRILRPLRQWLLTWSTQPVAATSTSCYRYLTVVLMVGKGTMPPMASWRTFGVGCCFMKTFCVPKSERNIALHLCIICVYIL